MSFSTSSSSFVPRVANTSEKVDRPAPRARSPRATSLTVVCAAIVASLAGTACNKIPGLGNKDADGGAAASGQGETGGGILSFLGSSFEGEITMNAASTPKTGSAAGKKTDPITLVFGLKSPKVRVDISGAGLAASAPQVAQGAAFIADPPTKKGYVLMPSQKRAMLLDFDKSAAMAKTLKGLGAAKGAPEVPSEPPKIDKTGKKSTVAGYECEEWKVTTKDGRADVCVAEGIKWVNLSDVGMDWPELSVAAYVGDVDRFPLRLVSYDAHNVETARVEATKIEKKKLDDSRFTVPADYQVMDMSALMQGLPSLGSAKKPPGFPPPARAR